MVKIDLDNATVEFRVLSERDKSLRGSVLRPIIGANVRRGSRSAVHVRALDSVSLAVGQGEKLGIMGSNGSGKTTLLRVLSRVYRPTGGVAAVEGSVAALSDTTLGMNPEASGVANIFLRGALLGMSKDEIKVRLDEIVDFSGLGDFIRMPMRTYSSGMQLRLSFSVSTVIAPDILVMDEWLAVGDEAFRKKAADRLSALLNDSKILALASHSRGLLEEICNRGIIMERGKIVRDGPIADVTSEYFAG